MSDSTVGTAWVSILPRLDGFGTALEDGAEGPLSRLKLLGVAAVGAIAVAALKLASTFQASMELIHTEAQVPQRDLKGLESGVESLAGKVGVGPNSLAQALYHIESTFASTGITGAKAMKLLQTAAEGARVGGADLTDVTNALDAAVVSGIKGVTNYHAAMGSLLAIVGAGDMQMQDLAAAMGTGLLASARSFGLSLSDVGAALDVFGDNNIRGTKAATDLRMAISLMGAPSAAATKALGTIGLSSTTLATDMTKPQGLFVALAALKAHLKDSGDTAVEAAQVIAHAFGGARTASSVLILLNNLDRLKTKYADIAKGAGGFDAAWAATQNTLKQKIADFDAWGEAVLTRLGMVLIPLVIKGADGIARAFDDVKPYLVEILRFYERIIDTVRRGFDGHTSGLSPFMRLWADLGRVIRDVYDFIEDHQNVFRDLAVGISLVAGALLLLETGPVGIIVGLITAFGLAYTKVKWFRDGVNDVARFLTDKVAPILRRFGADAAQWIGDAVTKIRTDVLPALERFGKDAAQWIGSTAVPAVERFARVVADRARPALERLAGDVKTWVTDKALPAIERFATTTWTQITTKAIPALKALGREFEPLTKTFEPLLRAFKTGFDGGSEKGFDALERDFARLGTVVHRLGVDIEHALGRHVGLVLLGIAVALAAIVAPGETLVAGLAVGAAYLYVRFAVARDIVADFVRVLVDAIDFLVPVANAVATAADVVVRGVTRMVDAVRVRLGGIEAFWGFVWRRLAEIVEPLIGAVVVIVRVALALIVELWRIFGGSIAAAVHAALLIAADIMRAAWREIQLLTRTAIGLVENIIKLALDLITGHWGDAWRDFTQILKVAWHYIVGTVGVAVDLVVKIVGHLLNLVKEILTGLGRMIEPAAADAWNGLVSTLGDAVSGVATALGSIASGVAGWLSGLGGAVTGAASGAWDGLTSALDDAVDGIATALGSIPGAVGGWLAGLPAAVAAAAAAGWDWLLSTLDDVDADMAGWFTSLPGEVAGWLAGLARAVGRGAATAWAWLWSTLSTVAGDVAAWFTSLPGDVGRWLADIAKAVASGAKTAWGWLSSTLTTVGGDVAKWFTDAVGEVGRWLADLARAVEVGAKTAWDWLSSTLTTTIEAVKTAITDLPAVIERLLKTLGSTVSRYATDAWNFISGSLATTIDAVKTAITDLPAVVERLLKTLGSTVSKYATDAWNFISSGATTAIGAAVKAIKGIPGDIRTDFTTLGGDVKTWAATAFGHIMTEATSVGGKVATWAGNLGGDIAKDLGSLANIGGAWVDSLWSGMAGAFKTLLSNLGSEIGKVLGLLDKIPGVKSLTGLASVVPSGAAGGASAAGGNYTGGATHAAVTVHMHGFAAGDGRSVRAAAKAGAGAGMAAALLNAHRLGAGTNIGPRRAR